ncbi:SulP family inorganic anion transporter [Cryomorphaceae bacterium]|nr:SulP family inorganic anion transporter [Cryomorphaceae bacterium]
MKYSLSQFAKDGPSGLVVFLVALPLCLGIALASGAPLLSGLISGIIAGIVVGSLSGSHLSVSGPAAGLTVIVLDAITEMGSFESFLVAVMLAGIIQLLMGVFKAGIIGLFFPVSVIRGMLAAIGIILILKQIPHFFGIDTDAFGEMRFLGTDGRNTFEEVIYATKHIEPGAFVIGILSLLILVVWDFGIKKRITSLSFVPGALLAVITGVVLNQYYAGGLTEWQLSTNHMVQIPSIGLDEESSELLYFPNFSALSNPSTYKVAMVIAIIASLETLLSIEAVDKLDPHKRRTPNNRELRAQGVGNLIAGAIGGLPMTAVIIRSSANVDAGAATKFSAVFHGILLAVCVLLIPHILNLIPLASLAAILLVVGFKLNKPTLYHQQFYNGWKQFMPFIITIIAILFSDLLIGIMIGLCVAIFFILQTNYNTPYFYVEDEHPEDKKDKQITIHLSEHVSFLNKGRLQKTLEALPSDSDVTIDGAKTLDIDFDVLNIIFDFNNTAHERNIHVNLVNIPELK